MRNILGSVAVIAAVATLGYVGTSAYFSDTEESKDNVLTTGTIDIAVDGKNPWTMTEPYEIEDMKPGYTDYIEFVIHNEGTNPANITKTLKNFRGYDVVTSEPECVAEGGTYKYSDSEEKEICEGNTAVDNLNAVIKYGMTVYVYDREPTAASDPDNYKWMQTIYSEENPVNLNSVRNSPIFLGMVPKGWYMRVVQSYHMNEEAGNKYQGDGLEFDIQLTAEQLTGSVVLEDKDTTQSPWAVNHSSTPKGTLTYTVKHPTFKFEFTGVAPKPGTKYVLAAGYDAGTNVDTYLGEATSGSDGTITITGDIELNKNLVNSKVWLIPSNNWTTSGMNWSGWNATEFLWETGLIEYYDTNLK